MTPRVKPRQRRRSDGSVSGLGSRIREARTRLGISIPQLEIALPVSEKLVMRWEHGRITPSAHSIVRLAQVLEVSADWLLGLEDPHA